MSEAREAVLARVREARADLGSPEPVPRLYRRRGERAGGEVVALFAERCAAYRAGVHRVAAAELSAAIAAIVGEWGGGRIAVPAGLPADWRPEGVEWVEDRSLTAADLDDLAGVLTGCAVAIADTGTVALDTGPRQGRRALSLVPDRHLCVVEAAQIVELVPEAIERLAGSAAAGRPITLVAGPSATSDIELQRVEGVHGPRVLEVVVVDAAT